jgi:hypothetical protein
MQRLRELLRNAHLLLLVLLLAVADVVLLAAGAGSLGKPAEKARQEVQIRRLNDQINEARQKLASSRFPQVSQVENLVLGLADQANQMGVQVTSVSSVLRKDTLAARQYDVVESSVEFRGDVQNLSRFLDYVLHETVDTLEIRSVNLRYDKETWVLQFQLRVFAEG